MDLWVLQYVYLILNKLRNEVSCGWRWYQQWKHSLFVWHPICVAYCIQLLKYNINVLYKKEEHDNALDVETNKNTAHSYLWRRANILEEGNQTADVAYMWIASTEATIGSNVILVLESIRKRHGSEVGDVYSSQNLSRSTFKNDIVGLLERSRSTAISCEWSELGQI